MLEDDYSLVFGKKCIYLPRLLFGVRAYCAHVQHARTPKINSRGNDPLNRYKKIKQLRNCVIFDTAPRAIG